ncbi:MAG: hypothetical protein H7X95_01320, partial [Deltaproteobacteria bacterium]|nr:hypothetical protein [Deltaproteobacteria bacterium]
MDIDAHLRLSFVTEQLPAILWTTDCALRISSAVGAGLSALGLTPHQVVGVSLIDFFAGDPGAERNVAAH